MNGVIQNESCNLQPASTSWIISFQIERLIRQTFQIFMGLFIMNKTKSYATFNGPVAQWITRLTTDQKIPGSTPGRLEFFVLEFFPSDSRRGLVQGTNFNFSHGNSLKPPPLKKNIQKCVSVKSIKKSCNFFLDPGDQSV